MIRNTIRMNSAAMRANTTPITMPVRSSRSTGDLDGEPAVPVDRDDRTDLDDGLELDDTGLVTGIGDVDVWRRDDVDLVGDDHLAEHRLEHLRDGDAVQQLR